MDVSDFFARHHFPELRRLEHSTFIISSSSWDHLSSHTSVLTTLNLSFPSPPFPTALQLLSILVSNPALQRVTFNWFAVPNNDGSGPSFRVQLHHLKELDLTGDVRHVITLLHQLDLPRNIEELTLDFHDCDVTDISQTIGPYLRDHLQCHSRPQDGLGLFVEFPYYADAQKITLCAGDAGGINFSAPEQIDTFVAITVVLNRALGADVRERAALDLITHVPREEVVYFHTRNDPVPLEDVSTQFPNVRALSIKTGYLSAAFPESTLAGDGRIFPSLEHILLKNMILRGGGWGPLMTFLARRVSSGHRLDTLMIVDSPFMSPEVMEGIGGMVRKLKL